MNRRCPSCSRINRIPSRHLAHQGKCGACKAKLPPQDTPIDVDPAAFDDIVSGAEVPVLVDFWAAWCGPCRMAAPEVKRLAASQAGRAVVLKVDTERHPELAARFGVRGIPNFAVFRAGELVAQHAGLVPAETMAGWLAAA